ncbi:flavodoxin family protein [Frankia gtarii]|uniref:flavodoxin family protein n=1 Tax=Frankia gtarii TaxID=2950102 RepID=UPI0021BE0CB2|nr:flavodoxin family protein [Frankia gtarii]
MDAPTRGLPPAPNPRRHAAPHGDSPSVRVAIVYHSGFGHTARQAQAVRAGVRRVPNVEALLVDVEQAPAHWEDLAAAAAIIFGTPTYMAGVSAAFKAFQEATSHAVMAQGHTWQDKIAAGFTNSGARAGDKLATLFQLALFAAQHGMHWVNLGLPPANNSTSGSEAELNRLGFWLGAGAQSNVDEGPDAAPPEADLRTAEHLGRRVAETALRFERGRGHPTANQPSTARPVSASAPVPRAT